MQPLLTNESCLKCHGQQGYQVGDIRGGVSIAVSMLPYLSLKKEADRFLIKSHALFWCVATGIILIFLRRSRTRLIARMQLQHSLVISEAHLRTERQRLDDIIRATDIGTWEWNVQTGETNINKRWAEIIGYTSDELSSVSIDPWINNVHPTDLNQSNTLLEKHFNGELDSYDLECRMKHRDGRWIWVMSRGKVSTWTEEGKPLLMFGIHTDIDEHKRIEEE